MAGSSSEANAKDYARKAQSTSATALSMRRLPPPRVGSPSGGKGVKILAIVDRLGLPLSVSTHAAYHHEVTLVPLSFDIYMPEAKPEHRIGDRASDSDGFHDALNRLLTKSASIVLASLRGSTYSTEYDSPLRSLRPCWTAFLNSLQAIELPSVISSAVSFPASSSSLSTNC
jgi:hypothetical protein